MRLSHPRRQQVRRLRKASRRGAAASLALAGAAVAAEAGALTPAIIAGIVGAGLLGDGVLAVRLAGRSRVGAVSETRVRLALDTLRAEGWRVAHGVSWRGRGDIDHVVCSPNGLGFAIETKTRRYSRAQLERTAATARWLARRRRRFPRGVLPMLCVVYDRHAPMVEQAVLIVSLDGLLDALRTAAAECPTSGRERRVRRRGDRRWARAVAGRGRDRPHDGGRVEVRTPSRGFRLTNRGAPRA